VFVNKKTIARYLRDHVKNFTIDEIENLIEIPPSELSFTYAFPCFRLAKFEKKAPKQIAVELVKNLSLPEFLEKIEAIGPYINFRVKTSSILENVFRHEKDYGKLRDIIGNKKLDSLKVVVEFPHRTLINHCI